MRFTLKAISCLVWILFSYNVFSQTQYIHSLIADVNSKYSGYSSGVYEAELAFKHWAQKDTVHLHGKMYFNKNIQDSSFLLFIKEDSLYYYFNGQSVYYLNFKFHYFEERFLGKKSVYEVLQGSIDYELIDWAAISAFEKKIETETQYDLKINFDNNHTIQLTETDTMRSPRFRYNYWIIDTLNKYVMQKTETIINLATGTIYKSYNYSPIKFSDSTLVLNQILNFDSLKQIFRYKFVDMEKPEKLFDSTLKVGEYSPQWTLKNRRNETVFSSAQVAPLTLIDFFYIGCIPCLHTFPQVQRIYDKFKNKVHVYAVNPINKNDELMADFIKRNSIKYDVLIDENKTVANKFKISGYPTLFLIDNNTGKIIYSHRGFDEKMESEITDLIKKYYTNE